MKIAVAIIAHNNFDNLQNILTALDHPQINFYLHVDKKVPVQEARRHLSEGHQKRINFLTNRIPVNWGGFSMVNVTLQLMKRSLRDKFDYLVLFSSQHLPIQSAENIISYLEANHGKEFIDYNELPYSRWNENGGLDRLRYHWFVDEAGIIDAKKLAMLQKENKMERTLPGELVPYGGSQWWVLSYNCIKSMLQFINYNPVYVDFFQKTLIPDELFFHTLLMNSDFSDDVVNDNLLYADWKKGPHFPRMLTMDDISAINGSGKLFARKFSTATDAGVIQSIMQQVMH
jgi:hypothetical protein